MNYIINQKVETFIALMNITCLLFLRHVHKGHLSLEDTDDEQSNFAAKKQNLDKGNKIREKYFFWNKLGLLFEAREKVLNNFKSISFLKKTKQKKKK